MLEGIETNGVDVSGLVPMFSCKGVLGAERAPKEPADLKKEKIKLE